MKIRPSKKNITLITFASMLLLTVAALSFQKFYINTQLAKQSSAYTSYKTDELMQLLTLRLNTVLEQVKNGNTDDTFFKLNQIHTIAKSEQVGTTWQVRWKTINQSLKGQVLEKLKNLSKSVSIEKENMWAPIKIEGLSLVALYHPYAKEGASHKLWVLFNPSFVAAQIPETMLEVVQLKNGSNIQVFDYIKKSVNTSHSKVRDIKLDGLNLTVSVVQEVPVWAGVQKSWSWLFLSCGIAVLACLFLYPILQSLFAQVDTVSQVLLEISLGERPLLFKDLAQSEVCDLKNSCNMVVNRIDEIESNFRDAERQSEDRNKKFIEDEIFPKAISAMGHLNKLKGIGGKDSLVDIEDELKNMRKLLTQKTVSNDEEPLIRKPEREKNESIQL